MIPPGSGNDPGRTLGTIRRVAYTTVALAYVQIVFGAIVRITGSGMGCGDSWPRCQGRWFPPLDRPDLVVEITHRFVAAGLIIGIIALLALASRHRAEPGVAGRGGVLRAALLAAGLVLTAAIFGAITVKLSLDPYVIVTHLAIAMILLAVLGSVAVRAGGFGVARARAAGLAASARLFRSGRAAVVMAFLTVIMGALTANIAGANVSCQGFPGCRVVAVRGEPLYIQVTHRALAFVLLLHTFGMAMAARRRAEPALVRRGAWLAFAAVVLQLLVAAALVEMKLPPLLRSLHQAVGTLVWLSIFVLAAIARRTAAAGEVALAPGTRAPAASD